MLTHCQIQEIFRCKEIGRSQRLGAAFGRSYGVPAKSIRDIWNGISFPDHTQNLEMLGNPTFVEGIVGTRTCSLETANLRPIADLPQCPSAYLEAPVGGCKLARNSAPNNCSKGIGIKWQFPLLARTPPRRFWSFDYSIKPIANMLDSTPAVSNAVERILLFPKEATLSQDDIDDFQIPDDKELEILETSGSRDKFLLQSVSIDDQGELAKDLIYGTVEVDVSRSVFEQRTQTWENALSLHSINMKSSQPLFGTDLGYVIPLVELDLLCIFLFDLLHANSPKISRYLRLWSGIGGTEKGVLVEWCTEKVLKDKVIYVLYLKLMATHL